MKILIIDQIARVNYKYTFSLVNALVENGNNIEIIIDDKSDNEYCKCKYYNKFLTSKKNIGKLKKIINYYTSYKFLVKKAIKESFDVVHVQWFPFSPMDYWYLRKLKKHGIKIVITVHDILPFNEKKYDMPFHKKIYGLGEQIIVQAESNINRFSKLFPEYKTKVSFIPHGHFLDFSNVHDKANARNYLDIPQDKFVILFFGQIKKVKGIGILLTAFGNLIKKRKDIYLVIAGNVWKDDFTFYQKIIDKYQLTAENLKLDIRFIPDKEVEYYYSSCDIAVLPYLDVYQSGVIQLSYAYGKAVIATSIAAFMEIVKDGETGFLCKVNDADDLAQKIEIAIKKKSSLAEIGRAGMELIEKKYSWKDIAKQVTVLYQKNSGEKLE